MKRVNLFVPYYRVKGQENGKWLSAEHFDRLLEIFMRKKEGKYINK
jgi:hypothetical protein